MGIFGNIFGIKKKDSPVLKKKKNSSMSNENIGEKEWNCRKCGLYFWVSAEDHYQCINSPTPMCMSCPNCGAADSLSQDVLLGRDPWPSWLYYEGKPMINPQNESTDSTTPDRISNKPNNESSMGISKIIHNPEAIKRDITFDGKGGASEQCCENCRWGGFTLDRKYLCQISTSVEVDRKDLCLSWMQR